MKHLDRALRVIMLEGEAILNLSTQIDEQFNEVVDCILKTQGRVIVCGMGKSGIIGKKISATLASTGTPSFSMHPGEAFHGDLGMVVKEDIFLAISNSGETDEVIRLLPFLKDNGNTLISMTGNSLSTLAKESKFHVSIAVHQEACPLKLAPTSSTTATLVMGDALAIALMRAREFRPENFAKFHPGGNLGRKLIATITEEMITQNLPVVSPDSNVLAIIDSISKGEQGLVVVLDKFKKIAGLITDGDLRRAIEHYGSDVFNVLAQDIMSEKPIQINGSILASYGRELMEEKKINKLLVSENGELVGILRK
ncbi:MAG: KpsF/GutQ family sugar-phosphate isomerase [Paraglaciecola sp.]|uniref:KpsF/GutQ family sugar-phosphate isomerase n=3 Tax=Paraglaciecola sp. TaxID=1920173 RepID=UPI003267AB51